MRTASAPRASDRQTSRSTSPSSDQAVDEPGDAALAEEHAVGQLAHPDPPVRRLRDGQQGVVLGERQVVLGAQLLVEAARDPGVGLQERAPRLEARVSSVMCWSRGSVVVILA